MNQITKKLSIANVVFGYSGLGLFILAFIVGMIPIIEPYAADVVTIHPAAIIGYISLCFLLVNAILGIPLSIAEKKEKDITKKLSPKAISITTLTLSIASLVCVLFAISTSIANMIIGPTFDEEIMSVLMTVAEVLMIIGFLCSITITIFSTIVVAKAKKNKK